ncbi:sensor histidine kinase [Cognatishimia sp. SS12]|uniref:sensor histidine kinase n=1 Tax=Cognatishimia sp. SS12 TaxID=2979465 RepID=UPI002330A6FA|nr:sensor histidine kinase [Cognatishimia sp. SS12]MDC0736852.1 sensor histidine kinase [Cognatishimia sp. SS12]
MGHFIDIWQYMPHGMCLLWQPWLVVLWAGSDVLIFAAYTAIPVSLLRVLKQRPDLRNRKLVLLFAGFILLCGLTHLLNIVTLWWPIYPYVGIAKLATGLVSGLTALVLFRLVPTLIAIPSHGELEALNQKLREQVAKYEASEAELREIKLALEATVAERTEELEQANAKMAVVAREAVHRSKNLLAVVGSIARQSARGQTNIDDYVSVLLGRINALASATSMVIGGDSSASADLGTVVDNQLTPLRLTYEDRIRVDGPDLHISSEAAQQFGLALHELATNTQKYGALSGDDGQVSVTWRRETEAADPQLVVEWQEDLSGMAGGNVEGTASFGSTLLTKIIPTMLQGTAERVIESDRLVYRLRVPIHVLETDESAQGTANMAARVIDANFGMA